MRACALDMLSAQNAGLVPISSTLSNLLAVSACALRAGWEADYAARRPDAVTLQKQIDADMVRATTQQC